MSELVRRFNVTDAGNIYQNHRVQNIRQLKTLFYVFTMIDDNPNLNNRYLKKLFCDNLAK